MEVAPSLEWNIIISGLPNWFDCSNFVQVFSLQSVKPKKKKRKKKKPNMVISIITPSIDKDSVIFHWF